jgi:hypothetical protein
MKIIYLGLFLFLVLTCSFAQEVKVKSTWVKLTKIKDKRIVSFENDSIRIDFSAKDVENYIFKELQQPRWRIKEYEGKIQLKDSIIKNHSDTTLIKINVPFTTEKVREDMPLAMLSVSYDLLITKLGKVTMNNKCYQRIGHMIFNGPYGNKDGVLLLDNKIFFRYLISLGE